MTHGFARHDGTKLPEYSIWSAMKDRCHNPKAKMYPYYGARGIAVCDQWRASFVVFLRDVGRRPEAHLTLDRLDNSKGYEPGNTGWVTRAQQVRNRRNNILVEYGGRQWILTDLATASGLAPNTLQRRLSRGMPVEAAVAVRRVDTKGINSSQAKLTVADVIEIRRRIGLGITQRAIGKDFGITQSAVSLIKSGVNWASIS